MSTNMADWQYTIYAQDKALDGVDDLALLSAVEGRITEITDLAATLAVRVAGVRGAGGLRQVLADLNLASVHLRLDDHEPGRTHEPRAVPTYPRR
jgi:hypothetical protein